DERSRSDIINSSGSGFVYDIEGHIVTNAHVVLGAREILVTFSQNIVTSAEIVGYDVYSDLAVIKVDVDPNLLIPVTFANSNDVKVGQYIVAIGNPFGLQSSMTTGIVSAIGRILPSQQLINPLTSQVYSNPAIIQIDAAVNPGNSGGPILNLDGQVIGIATAIRSETGLFQGIAYAVPANTIQRIIPQLIETGRAEYSWLGVSTVNNDEPGFSMAALAIELDLPVNYGVLVTQVLRNSPAEAAGLRGGTENVDIRGSTVSVGGDIIIGINGQEIMNLDELLQYLVENTSPGDTVTLTVIRDEQVLEIPVVLGTRPSVD
ncbi:MAG: trypsin, partial [Phototrophicales bacterium]